MEKILEIVNFLAVNAQPILSALVAMITAIIAIAAMIPGDQPEKFLQSVVDFISKFSKKPSEPEDKK
jgi:hypothetical protein